MKIAKTIRPHCCANGACPGILVTGDGDVLIQGAKIRSRKNLGVPPHEDLVRIPKAVFDDLVRQYRR